MMISFDYNYQEIDLRQATVFIVFFCEELLMFDTNLHNKDCNEMHSGSCSQTTSHANVLLGESAQAPSPHSSPTVASQLFRVYRDETGYIFE